mmetsp:Transcript_30953/g.40869  ORF Transcript_30953/g.40869 Transcript_30953/m.40869 type:complete len:386 (-) Transcript_30953:240-1397(-)
MQQKTRKRSILVSLSFVFAILISYLVFIQYIAITSFTEQELVSEAEEGKRETGSFLAEKIVHRAYFDSYKVLEACKLHEFSGDCYARILREARTSTLPISHPWWFQTLLRDTSGRFGHGLHGKWHNMSTLNPDLWVCSIEKVATSQWRAVFQRLNRRADEPETKNPIHYTHESGYPHKIAPHIVFLRDPLERFMSAYIDKCVRGKQQGHCEPNPIFNSNKENTEIKTLFKDLEEYNKLSFAAYVDTMPFKWNVHFMPQGLMCNGLFRHISKYDFVGIMGSNFYQDLRKLGKQIGGRFETALEDVFHIEELLNSTDVFGSLLRRAKQKPGDPHIQNSRESIEQYYTPRTLRRVLEYVSIDYVALNLPIPAWAEQMLALDEEGSKNE